VFSNILSPTFVTDLRLLMVDGGIRFIAAIFILVVGWMLATWAKRWIMAALAHLPIDATLKPLLASLVRYLLLVLTVVLVLDQFGVQTASLIAVLGAAGIAIGLALQGTLANVAAGVMLLVLRPFRVGHFVEVAGGRQGTIREIGLFTTVMTTRDLYYVSIPNSAIFTATIINYTREPLRRVKFTVPVDSANDMEAVEKVILEVVAAHPNVLKTPAPSTVVQELQEYTALFTVRAYAHSEDYWKTLYALQKSVRTALNKAGILIPVTRQAVANRTEPRNDLTKPPPSKDEPQPARMESSARSA
jgi:small conductance mechanosensitive channel